MNQNDTISIQDAHQGPPHHHVDSPSPAPPSIAGGSDSMDATVASTPNNSASSLANSPTPPKKDRSSTRKTCQYCHKVSVSAGVTRTSFDFQKECANPTLAHFVTVQY